MGEDRISKLDDGVLGHILSFLPSSKESARAAALSTRWRDAYAAVHTVSLAEPDTMALWRSRLLHGDPDRRHDDSDGRPPFAAAVTAALLARGRRLASPSSGSDHATPVRALRVVGNRYRPCDSSKLDLWISFALQQAAPQLELHIRFRCSPDGGGGAIGPEEVAGIPHGADEEHNSPSSLELAGHVDDDHDYAFSTDDDDKDPRDPREAATRARPEPEYTVPRALFSCAALRALRIGPCRLAPPAAISLPSLETLLLAGVYDEGCEVQRLVSACPRLADLTLKACRTVTALRTTRLRRLALRYCPNLAAVAVDAPELRAFEYRGAVPPDASLLATAHGGSCQLASCKIKIYGPEVMSEAELAKLRGFLGLFAAVTERLHLRSFSLGSGIDAATFATLPEFSALRRLELRGCLPRDDAPYAVVAAMGHILRCAPDLEALTLVFEMGSQADLFSQLDDCYGETEEVLDDAHAHHLKYNRHDVLYELSAVGPCRVREINLVHYQGGWAQRSLAKFLLCNAPAIQELYCGLAGGPLWIQTELMMEIQGWVMNDMASIQFH